MFMGTAMHGNVNAFRRSLIRGIPPASKPMMADPLAPFIHQLEWTALKFLIPAAIFAGVIQIFGKDMAFWALRRIKE
jgi:hypothetical protein